MEILVGIVVLFLVAAAIKAASAQKPKGGGILLLPIPPKPRQPQGCGLLIVALLAGLAAACGVALAF